MTPAEEIKTLAGEAGAACVGIADLAPFKEGWTVLPADLLGPFTRAVSVAVRLDNAVIAGLEGGRRSNTPGITGRSMPCWTASPAGS